MTTQKSIPERRSGAEFRPFPESAGVSPYNLPPIARGPNDSARVAGCGRTKIFEAIAEGKLKARKLGRKTLILDDDLRAWLASLPLVDKQAA